MDKTQHGQIPYLCIYGKSKFRKAVLSDILNIYSEMDDFYFVEGESNHLSPKEANVIDRLEMQIIVKSLTRNPRKRNVLIVNLDKENNIDYELHHWHHHRIGFIDVSNRQVNDTMYRLSDFIIENKWISRVLRHFDYDKVYLEYCADFYPFVIYQREPLLRDPSYRLIGE
jgi:hypothetical protein